MFLYAQGRDPFRRLYELELALGNVSITSFVEDRPGICHIFRSTILTRTVLCCAK